MAIRTSTQLTPGAIYSREDLQRQFQITDATIRTGVFHPAGHDSVWLFITENKPVDRTPYIDRLNGDQLLWEGQLSGRTDRMIVNHAADGLELVVFYRRSKDEFPDYGFRYEGRFEYVSHEPGDPAQRKPSRFVLGRQA